MRRFPLIAAILALTGTVLAQDVAPEVSFKPEKSTYKVGEDIKGTVTVTFAPGLHGYQNPPSKDYMLPVKVSAGAGTTLKSVVYPKGHLEMAGGEEAAVYSGTVRFPVVLAGPTKPGKSKLSLAFFYQQCDEQSCYIPNTINVSADVTIEAAKTTEPPPGGENPGTEPGTRVATTAPTIEVTPLEAEVETNSDVTFTITISPASGKYILGSSSTGTRPLVSGPNLVSYSVSKSATRSVAGSSTSVHVDPVALSVVVKIPSDGSTSVPVTIEYVQADREGLFEAQTENISLEFNLKSSPTDAEAPDSAPDESDEDSAATSNDGGLLGFLNRALEQGNWALIVPAALLAGLALCLTPCVFPMIPVTVSFFSNQGAKTKAGQFSLGLFYALGITITYGAVGGISAAAGGAVGQLFTKPWFVILLAVLLVALALSMFDVYEIRLPGFIQKNLKGRSGPVGALIMGLLMGFAAAPCAGALVGAVAVKVAEIGSIPTGLGMFGLIGLGMGLPFMVLATASSGAKGLPKSGGWLKTTKAVLGLVVLYFAATYLFQGLGMKPEQASTQIGWIAVFLAMAVYLLFIDKSDATRAVGTIKGVACVGLGLLVGMAYSEYNKINLRESLSGVSSGSGSQVSALGIDWIPYNEENFAKAVASGKTIMIDGKADWCVQCREIEHGVFLTPDGLKALSDVYLMSVDWSTGVSQAYIEETKERFGITGLPHIVFMEPGGKNEFAVKDIKTVDELKQHLRKAGASL